jgi:hypothetical protein
MRRIAIVLCAAGLALPAAARADGGPVGAMQGGTGVGVPGSRYHYVAVSMGGRTLLERLRGGRVDWWKTLRGQWGIPAATVGGTGTGLSADRRTLVLSELPRRYPVRRTRLMVLAGRGFAGSVRERVTLAGWFSVDAISPDGRRLYLIHYTRPNNYLRYEVRAYDLASRRLEARPIVDPREPDEKMQGIASQRVMSADSRWAYTLYMRPQGAPFIHALDTRAGTAACIDLDGIGDTRLWLVPPRGRGPLVVAGPDGPLKLVDRRTFAVSNPAPAATPRRPAQHRAAAAHGGGGGPPWGAGAALLAAIALLGLTTRAARARSAAQRRAV